MIHHGNRITIKNGVALERGRAASEHLETAGRETPGVESPVDLGSALPGTGGAE